MDETRDMELVREHFYPQSDGDIIRVRVFQKTKLPWYWGIQFDIVYFINHLPEKYKKIWPLSLLAKGS